MRKKRRYPQVKKYDNVGYPMLNDYIVGEIKRTEQHQEEGPEYKTFHSSRRVKSSKSTENEKEPEKSKSMIETDTGKLFFMIFYEDKIIYTLTHYRGNGDPRSCS